MTEEALASSSSWCHSLVITGCAQTCYIEAWMLLECIKSLQADKLWAGT